MFLLLIINPIERPRLEYSNTPFSMIERAFDRTLEISYDYTNNSGILNNQIPQTRQRDELFGRTRAQLSMQRNSILTILNNNPNLRIPQHFRDLNDRFLNGVRNSRRSIEDLPRATNPDRLELHSLYVEFLTQQEGIFSLIESHASAQNN